MNTQPISNSPTVMNSVTNQDTTHTAFGLPTEPTQDPVNNNDSSPRGPPSSDWDFFGDDEEFLQALETSDAAWPAVPGTQQTQDDSQHADSIVQPSLNDSNDVVTEAIVMNQSQVSNIVDVDDPRSDFSTAADAMLISDHYADLPNSPEFSLDDLPIFSKQNTVEDREGENEHPQTQHSELDMLVLDLDSKLGEPAVNDSSNEVVDFQFTQKMDMLDIISEPPSTTDADSRKKSNGCSGQPASPTAITENEPGSRLKLSLRQRNAIQLHPFTIEHARFQHLLGRSSMKGKIKAISTQVTDSQDTEFTPSNTQLVDAATDEIQTSQPYATSSRRRTTSSKKMNNKKTSLPSKVRGRTQNRLTTTTTTNSSSSSSSSSSRTTSRADTVVIDDTPSPVFDKYGLDILQDTTRTTDAGKSKIITFQKKKRSRREKSAVRRFPPSSSASALKKDIFDFDALPRSTFNFATSQADNLNASSIAVSDQDRRVQQQLREMNDEADFNDFDYSMEDDEDEETDDMDIDNEDMVKRRFRIKKHSILDSSDEDSDEGQGIDASSDEEGGPAVEQELTESELDAIFDFPGAGPSSTIKTTNKRLIKPSRDDDIVPIVQDELEYREHKRQRVGLQDVLKKKKTLKSILPASFLKVYHKELLEEDRFRKTPKKRTTHAAKSTPTTTATAAPASATASATAKQNKRSTNKPHADVFAAFLGSQSDDDSDDDSDNMQDAYPTLDDYVTRLDYPTQIPAIGNARFEGPSTTTSDLLGFFGKSTFKQAHLNPEANSNSGSARQQPHSEHGIVYPVEESIEDNRVQRQYQGSPSPKKARKSTTRAPRSSIAIKQSAKSRRKKVRRTRDDIYVHTPYSYRAWSDRSGQAPDNNGRRYFQERADMPRMAFDDIYVGTRQYVRYANESLDGERFNDIFSNQQIEHIKEKLNVHVVHTLPNVISRVRHLHDYDLRRILGLKDTVYLHHRLLAPLLSPIPNLKSAYKHLASNYTDLKLFEKHLLWRSIVPKNKSLIGHLFYRISGDIYKVCKQDILDGCMDLPGHDHVYTFVSICLTQWIPLHQYDDRLQLTEMFMRYIRYLGRFVPQLVEDHKTADLAWRPIVKLMVFILDWTCRLHHLGVHQIDWSVTLCTKALIDILVFIGFDDIKACSKDYLSEAWICLLQIMSVSSKTSGFYFHEQVFLDQITDSIKTKSRSSDVYEFEKRRTTRLWAESLNFIIEKYMMP
ncbi:hypothetical protein BD408DRAFT_245703 [Parasitella parasitica]|nr:hypothetical protein BD408DRAFT_245703 [Parasitella parasitica]